MHTPTHIICYTSRFSTETLVTGTRIHVTLHVHCLSFVSLMHISVQKWITFLDIQEFVRFQARDMNIIGIKMLIYSLNSYPHVKRWKGETAGIHSGCVVGSGRECMGKYSVNRPKAQTPSDIVRKHQFQTITSHATKASLERSFTKKYGIQPALLFAYLFVNYELELKILTRVD
jgi:hypothetical protein